MSSVFLKITEAVRSTENLGELFATIHRIVGGLMPVNNFFIAFCERDAEGGEYISFPFFVDERDEAPVGRLPLGQTLTGYVIRRGQPLLLTPATLARLEKSGEINPAIGSDPRIWLGVPLRVQGQVIGAVVLQSYKRSGEYGEREKGILTVVSEQIAVAIELARYRQNLEDLVQQRTRELKEEQRVLSVLFDISQAVYRSAGLRDFLSVVHRKVGELMDARNFYVALYDEETARYIFPYFADEYDSIEELKPEDLHYSLTDYVRRQGALLADDRVHRQLIDAGEVRGVVGTDSMVWLGVPLFVPGKAAAIGVMTVQSYEDRQRFTEKEKRVLQSAAAIVALAVDRIRMASDMIHHFSNAITGIHGNSEMLQAAFRQNAQMLEELALHLRACSGLDLPAEAAVRLREIQEIVSRLGGEWQGQAGRVSRIIEGIDLAALRVSRVFQPLLANSGGPQEPQEPAP